MSASRNHPPLPSQISVRIRGTDHGKTSAHNRLMVWEMLRQHGPQSRRQLSQLSHLGNSTLTYLVRDLFELGMVRDKGKRDSKTVGKKQEMMEINPDYGMFGGFFIEGGEVSATLIDAAGVERDHRRLHCGKRIEDALDTIDAYLNEYRGDDSGTHPSLLGIGLAIPGIVDCVAGHIIQCWRLELDNYDLAHEVQRRWDLPFVVENDVKLAAWSEAEQLEAQLPDSLIFLAINASDDETGDAVYGMGMSVIHNGQLMAGTHSAAGELRNLRAMFGTINLTKADVSLLSETEAEPNESLDSFGSILGNMLAVLTDLIDPGLVVIGGSLEIRNRRFLDGLEKQVASTRVHQRCDQLKIRTSTSGERGVANGAAMLARRSVVREMLTSLDKSSGRRPASVASANSRLRQSRASDQLSTRTV